jgi:hypothetical protein
MSKHPGIVANEGVTSNPCVPEDLSVTGDFGSAINLSAICHNGIVFDRSPVSDLG